MTEHNDVDVDILLDSMDPPTYAGRVLLWSGDDRIPHPGELVFYTPEPTHDEHLVEGGVVVGYFQAHGFLGVKLRLTSGQEIGAFGAEVTVSPDEPERGSVQ